MRERFASDSLDQLSHHQSRQNVADVNRNALSIPGPLDDHIVLFDFIPSLLIGSAKTTLLEVGGAGSVACYYNRQRGRSMNECGWCRPK